jgi:hypothetical protein
MIITKLSKSVTNDVGTSTEAHTTNALINTNTVIDLGPPKTINVVIILITDNVLNVEICKMVTVMVTVTRDRD